MNSLCNSTLCRLGLWLSLVPLLALGACTEESSSGSGAAAKDAVGSSDATSDLSATGDTVAADQSGSGADTTAADSATADAPVSDLGDVSTDAAAGKYLTCVDVGQCVALSCAATAAAGCEKPCLAGATESALQTVVPLLGCSQGKCLEGQCKGSKDPDCVDGCMKSACLPELLACLDTQTTGTKTCATVSACFDSCNVGEKGGFACLASCYNGMDAKGKAAAKAIGACFAKAPAGQDPTKSCGPELVTCMVGDSSGPKECFEIFPCMEACKSTKVDDFQCTMQCLAKTTKPGQAAFLDMVDCLGDKGISPQCQGKFLTCINPTGSGDCYGGLGCVAQCQQAPGGSKDGPDCLFQCAHAMTKTAAAQFLEASQCFGGGGTPEQQQACSGKLVQCIGASGTASCANTIGCVQACPKDNGTCMYGCLKKGSSASATEAWSLLQCSGGSDPGKCLPLVGSCYGKGTSTCAQVLSCAAACNGKPECGSACLGQGSSAAAMQGYLALQCFGKNDPACLGDVTTCIGPVGTKSCTELSACLFTQCNGKTGQEGFSCHYSCLAQGSTKSVNEFFTWDSCTKTCNNQCPSGSPGNCLPTCYQSKCAQAFSECAPSS